jgi:hypothetical protein
LEGGAPLCEGRHLTAADRFKIEYPTISSVTVASVLKRNWKTESQSAKEIITFKATEKPLEESQEIWRGWI